METSDILLGIIIALLLTMIAIIKLRNTHTRGADGFIDSNEEPMEVEVDSANGPAMVLDPCGIYLGETSNMISCRQTFPCKRIYTGQALQSCQQNPLNWPPY